MATGTTKQIIYSTERTLALALILFLFACSGNQPFQIELMPAPEVYDEDFNPFTDTGSIDDLPYQGVLYAADRARGR